VAIFYCWSRFATSPDIVSSNNENVLDGVANPVQQQACVAIKKIRFFQKIGFLTGHPACQKKSFQKIGFFCWSRFATCSVTFMSFLLEQVCNLLRNVYEFFAGAGLQPAP
jgi:hypothetical protein